MKGRIIGIILVIAITVFTVIVFTGCGGSTPRSYYDDTTVINDTATFKRVNDSVYLHKDSNRYYERVLTKQRGYKFVYAELYE